MSVFSNDLLTPFAPITLEQMSGVKLMNRTDTKFVTNTEKLCQLLRQNGADVQNHLFEGRHSGDYIKSNMETYLRFYSLRTTSILT